MVGYLTVRHQKYVKKVISFIVLIALLSVISLCFSPGDSAYAASSGEVVMEAGSLRVLEGSNMHVRTYGKHNQNDLSVTSIEREIWTKREYT